VVGLWIRNCGVIYDGARDSPEPASAGGEHNSHVNSAMRSILKQLATNFSIPFQAGHGLCLFGVILWATYIQPFSLSRCHAVRTCSALNASFLRSFHAWTPPTAAFGSFLAAGSSLEANALSPEAASCAVSQSLRLRPRRALTGSGFRNWRREILWLLRARRLEAESELRGCDRHIRVDPQRQLTFSNPQGGSPGSVRSCGARSFESAE
jgi:hypothetical protein